MTEMPRIPPPASEDDADGARRVFAQFNEAYRPVLEQVDLYLDTMISKAPPAYADGYRHWHRSLRDLLHGVFLMAKRIPIPSRETFQDALRVFSLESSAQFIADLCAGCKQQLPRNWAQGFRQHIELLLHSLAILMQNRDLQFSR